MIYFQYDYAAYAFPDKIKMQRNEFRLENY